ncbi:sugar kinase [Brevibacillus sp. SYP-B805]|uniref:sugar kinase n=1 Tax=Brevibacillus sp. SYP-B805 TaxID=1578199 RepID=UPI0013EE3190|nr:sugar kinase [Brevibacillus sp. SYP-B805]NGQ95946.1 sugar kinase [Brevibacillus sp. SYP-B805]
MDVVTLGETMVLFHPAADGPLRYVHQFEKTIGGAESNVAIGLARLGAKVSWISRLGDDEFGLYVRNFIRGEGVDTSGVVFDPRHPTAVFFKERQPGRETRVYYYRKGSAASFMTPDDLDETLIAQARFLHLTGITPALSASCLATVERAIALARRHGLTITFDPNIRLKLWTAGQARETLTALAARCDIVLPGLEEGELLTGERTPEGIAQRLLTGETKAVVIKLGERGAFYATADGQEYVPGFPVAQVVDPIGAGDGFAAGLLFGLIRGWSYREAVRLGNRIGAYAVTVKGDVEGYPYWSQIAPDEEKPEIFR